MAALLMRRRGSSGGVGSRSIAGSPAKNRLTNSFTPYGRRRPAKLSSDQSRSKSNGRGEHHGAESSNQLSHVVLVLGQARRGLRRETSLFRSPPTLCAMLNERNSGRYAMPPKPPPEKPPEPLPDRLPVIRIKLPPKGRPKPPAKRPPPPPVVDPPPAHIC